MKKLLFEAMSTPKHKLRYPGDIKDDIIDQLSPSTKKYLHQTFKTSLLEKRSCN